MSGFVDMSGHVQIKIGHVQLEMDMTGYVIGHDWSYDGHVQSCLVMSGYVWSCPDMTGHSTD